MLRDKRTGMTDFDAESYLAQLTTRPGVYQMFDDSGELLYVGKAKNLKNRVTSYFRASGLSDKTMALVARKSGFDTWANAQNGVRQVTRVLHQSAVVACACNLW